MRKRSSTDTGQSLNRQDAMVANRQTTPADMPQEMKAVLRKFLLQQLSKEKP